MAYLTSSKHERRLLERKNKELALRAQGTAIDPDTVERIVRIARNWPGLKPGAALSFGQAGFHEGSPEVKEAAKLSFKQQQAEKKWALELEQYTQEDIDKETDARHPDPQFVLQGLLPRYVELQKKNRVEEGAWEENYDEYQQVVAGLKYASLAFTDKELTDVAKQMGFKRQIRDNLRSLAADARYAHEHGGAGDISKMPYVGPVLENVVKPVVREATLIGQAPLEAGVASLRNVAGGGNPLFSESGVTAGQQTQIGTQVENWMQGETTNVGDGFLPSWDSPVAEETAELQRSVAPTIGGHAWTPGRAFGNVFFEPDTLPFQVTSGFVDATIAIKADPASALLGTLGDMRQASKRFAPTVTEEAVGVYNSSSRLHLDQVKKGAFLAGDTARKGAERLGEIGAGNPSAMYRAINNSNLASPAFPITTVHGEKLIEELADAQTTDEFLEIMQRTTQVQTPFRAPGVTYHIKNQLDSRLLAAMPRGTIDITDKNHAWKTLDDYMRAGKVPIEQRDAALNTMIRSDDQFAAITAAQDAVEGVLVNRYGVDQHAANQYASFFSEANRTSRSYDVDQMTGNTRLRPGITIAGEAHYIDSPRLLTEGLNAPLQIPNTRDLRRIATELNTITATDAWKTGQTVLRAPQAIWSPLQILSVRQATRDVFETQLNLAARGYVNWFTKPIEAVGTIIGARPGTKLSTWLEKIPGMDAKYGLDAQGANLIAAGDDLLMHSMLQFSDPDTILTRGYMQVPRGDARAAEGFVEELNRMNGDPVMAYLASASDPAAAKAWFWSGEGAEHRLARAPMLKRIDDDRMAKVASGEYGNNAEHIPYGDIANDPAAADRFIDEVLYPSLLDQTSGNTELLDAVATGQLGGHSLISHARSVGGEDLSIANETAALRARALLDEGYGPASDIKVRQSLKKDASDLSAGTALAKNTVEKLFHAMVDLPDRFFNRNMAWQQTQWHSYIDNAHLLSADDLAKLKAQARTDRISKDQLRQLNLVKTDVATDRRFTLEELTKLGKYEAASEMAKIVHDLASRSQFFDMLKFLVPFGDAFRLVATRMAKLAADEPQVLRRVTQGLMAARQPESNTLNRLLGDPVPEGQPFFHDDGFGQEVAIIPGSSKFNEAVWEAQNALADVTGIDALGPGGNPLGIPLAAHTAGFKMVGELMPGIGGPAVSFPAKWFIPEGTLPEQVEDLLFPMGYPESNGIATDIAETFMPKSVLRMMGGPLNEQALASGVNNQLAVLAETGDYDMKDPRDLTRMAEDARANAIWLERIRGFGSFVMPGFPSFEFSVEDKDGRLVLLQTIGKLVSDHSVTKNGGRDPDKGMEWFIKRFGSENIFAIQPASRATGYAAPVSSAGKRWADAHPEVKKEAPLVYGFFAPEGNEGDIDNWNNLFKQGEMESLTAEEQIAAAQNRLGLYAVEQKKDEILKANGGRALTDKQEDWFREAFVPDLKKNLPGFDTYIANPIDTPAKRRSAVEQLYSIANLPSVAETDAGQGLQQYLVGRDKAIEAAKGKGYDLAGPWQAKKALPLRDWLRKGAQEIIEEHPSFAPLWEQIFSREMTKDVK